MASDNTTNSLRAVKLTKDLISVDWTQQSKPFFNKQTKKYCVSVDTEYSTIDEITSNGRTNLEDVIKNYIPEGIKHTDINK